MSKLFRLIAVAFCATCLYSQQMCAQSQQLMMSISQLFNYADAHSSSIKSFETMKAVVAAEVSTARAAWLPEVEVSASISYLGNGTLWNRNFGDVQAVTMPHFGNNFAIKATQAIYTGGAITSGIKLAKLSQEMATLSAGDNKNRIHFLLVGYYLDMHNLANQATAYSRNIELTERLIEQMQARQNEGIVLKNDITRYELQLENLKLARTKVLDRKSIIGHQLSTIIGLDANVEILPDTCLNEQSLPMQSQADWQLMARNNSTGLQKSLLGVRMNEEKEKLQKAERLPKVAVVAEDHLDGPITIEVPVLNNNFNYWYVGLGVNYNISSLFKTNKKVRQAAISTRLSREEHTEAQEQVENAVQAAYTNYCTSFTELETQKKSVQLATQNYEIVSNRYNNGLALITDMIDASNVKVNAELALINSRIGVIFSYYNLKYISGTL